MRPIVLTILDGWGYSKEKIGNAILNASKPNMDAIEQAYPSALLQASGLAVGMTCGEAGNSEVGHLTLGAGRSIPQYLTRINRDIESGYFFENKELLGAINNAKSKNSTVHIIGLLGSGSVHSYFNHLLALIKLLKDKGIENYKLHLFTDGKDSSLQGAIPQLQKLSEYFPESISHIATILGRDFSMDRTGNWDVTQKTYDLWTKGQGKSKPDVYKALEEYYAKGLHDSNIPPTVIGSGGLIRDGDSLIFFNFREDSMRQIAKVFVDDYFDIFPRKDFKELCVVGFTQYLEELNLKVAYAAPFLSNGLAEYLSANGLKQFHIGETEKYAHVTYFFNCLKNKPFDGETDIFIKSGADSIAEPQMKANDIVTKVIEEMNRNYYDFIVINLANADVLAHLGNLESAIKGIETIDTELGRLSEAVLNKDGILLVTADHGNAERVIYKKSGDPETKHDQNPVPFYLIGREFKKNYSTEDIKESRKEVVGILSDVAPTILGLMQLPVPVEMTGDNLMKNLKL